MSSPLRWALCLLLALLVAAPARAVPVDDPDEEVARRHFALGSERYATADYAGALSEFELAKRARPVPALDFNIARCLDRLERYDEAIVAYQRYVEAMPDASDAPTVRERIAALRARVAPPPQLTAEPAKPPPVTPVQSAPPPTTTTTVVSPPVPSRSPYLVPGIVTGVTGVTLLAGAGLLGSLRAKFDHANGPNGCRPCTEEEIAPLRRQQAAGWAMIGLTGGLLVVDVALFVVAARKKR